MWNRIYALFVARNTEFFRDRSALAWSVLLPILIIFVFAYAFTDENPEKFKVGIYSTSTPSAASQNFIATRFIKFIEFEVIESNLVKVERHQIDLLFDADNLRYWINQTSPNGYIVEKLLIAAFAGSTQSPMTIFALVCVVLVAYFLNKTPAGLALCMTGENPMAVESQGLSVFAIRTGAVMLGSAFMAIGGAFLTMSAFDAFYIGMVNGRGWICIALVVFSSWKPAKALLGTLIFAAFDALQMRVQQQSSVVIPYQFYLMMPYVFSIVALIVMSRRSAYPKALLIPFRKGER